MSPYLFFALLYIMLYSGEGISSPKAFPPFPPVENRICQARFCGQHYHK